MFFFINEHFNFFQFVDIDDIDYQTSTSKLTVRWSGFEHPHEDINFTICVSNTTTESDFMVCDQSASANKHTFSDLDLKPYQVDNTEFNLKNNIFDGNVLFDIIISKATN